MRSSAEFNSGDGGRIEETDIFLANIADEYVVRFLRQHEIQVCVLDRHVRRDSARPEYRYFVVPYRTPANVLDALNAGFVKALQSTELRAHLAKLGVNAAGSTRGQFQDFMQAEVAKWARVIRDSGISP